ncbi:MULTISPECIES: DUF805 domain-containing protein [unclassified Rhizobium]|uniref:DUF805 domain-containing protein n=1 Tax=unclassified Rhizobium TaxID=2613769 RepID=UPI000EA93EEC|nr:MULTISPECIES: DUF805 domain-containing protein [unclassified Rhizobium]AYG69403.1 DUF805 domain-containing protein [Rhizobium sp. CCGE531]AYG75784.1 DUF805 domain-containing protein [Rhizobium sp. CCGE532]
MKKLLFTFQGRITRKKMWLAVLIHIIAAAVVGLVFTLLWSVIPGSISEDGTYHVEGAAAVPYIVLGLAYVIFSVWSGLAVAVKRLHDRNKSGWFFLIQFVPLIGSVWYLVEVLLLKGTTGSNRFGEDAIAA